MFDIFKLAWLEFKKIFAKKSTYIYLGIMSLTFFIIIDQIIKVPGAEKNVFAVDLIFRPIVQFVIIFQAVTILAEEFRFGTTTFLLTSPKTRTEILLSKVLANILYCFVLGFINFLLLAYYQLGIGQKVVVEYFYSIMTLYLIYGWFINNYFLFVTIIFKSRATSFVTGLFFLFLFEDILKALMNKFSMARNFISAIPFDNIFYFLVNPNLNSYKVYGMILGGLIFFVASAFIFEKRDV